MDIFLLLQVIVLFAAIFLGVKLGGMGIGYARWWSWCSCSNIRAWS